MTGDTPFSIRLLMAFSSRDMEKVDQIISECFGGIAHKLTAVSNSYDYSDLPFVIATMQITAGALKNVLDEPGRKLLDNLISHTSTVTINAEGLLKQLQDEEG